MRSILRKSTQLSARQSAIKQGEIMTLAETALMIKGIRRSEDLSESEVETLQRLLNTYHGHECSAALTRDHLVTKRAKYMVLIDNVREAVGPVSTEIKAEID